MVTVFKNKNISYNTTIYAQTVGENVGETVGKILKLIRINPNITRKELSDKLGLSIRGIEWNLQKMKQKGYIVRKGPNKSGYWDVLSKGDN